MLKIDNLIEPKYTLKIGENNFELDGSFQNLKNIQQNYDADILAVINEVFRARSEKLALVIKYLSAAEQSIEEIEKIMTLEYGWVFDDIRLALFEFLKIAVAPASQKKRKEAQQEAQKKIKQLLEIQKSYNSSLG